MLLRYCKFKILRLIKISHDRKVASNQRMLSMPEHSKSYVNSLNGLEAPLLENADFKNIGLLDIESISNSPKLKTIYLKKYVELILIEDRILSILPKEIKKKQAA